MPPVATPMLELADALWAAVMPASLVRRRACRLCRDGTVVLLIGTLHWGHLGRGRLKIGFLHSLIKAYGPAAIGIEARPHDLRHGLVGLSPIDMAYIWAMTQAAGQPVFGFDHWSEGDYEARAAQQAPLDFNSDERNDRMADLILEQVQAPGLYILFTGYGHVVPIRDRLLAQGFGWDRSFRLDMARLGGDQDAERILRPVLRPHLQQAVDHLDRYLQSLRQVHGDNAWVRRVQRKRTRLARILETAQPARKPAGP
jgi:hypothetical protein